MPEPVDLELHRTISELRRIGEAEQEGDEKIIGIFWRRWGLPRDDTTYATYEMAAPHFEDFLHGPNAPLISENELANAVFFFRRRRFEDIPYDKATEVYMGADGVYPTLDLDIPNPAFDNEPTRNPRLNGARDHYVWATTELGLRDKPYWHDLDLAVAEMCALYGDDADDDGERANALLKAITTVQWVLKTRRGH
jgi:hypothetical protein